MNTNTTNLKTNCGGEPQTNTVADQSDLTPEAREAIRRGVRSAVLIAFSHGFRRVSEVRHFFADAAVDILPTTHGAKPECYYDIDRYARWWRTFEDIPDGLFEAMDDEGRRWLSDKIRDLIRRQLGGIRDPRRGDEPMWVFFMRMVGATDDRYLAEMAVELMLLAYQTSKRQLEYPRAVQLAREIALRLKSLK